MTNRDANWIAIVPLKQATDQKSRLSPHCSPRQRDLLAQSMAAHVVSCLKQAPSISRVGILSRVPRDEAGLDWIADENIGLNAGFSIARNNLPGANLVFIHADLPLLCAADIEDLISAALRSGVAIAPDRHGVGTNAVAILAGHPFAFHFGENSLSTHMLLHPEAELVRSTGLSTDIDTPDDLGAAYAAGFRPPADFDDAPHTCLSVGVAALKADAD